MKSYLVWNKSQLTNLTEKEITDKYDHGFVFVRTGKGEMIQTRSLRIDLSKFEFSSENRRIMKKTDGMKISAKELPLAGTDYSWTMHKLGKDFYQKKFGEKIFSASKIKELLTDPAKSNYNLLYTYKYNEELVGYAILYVNSEIAHYAYPFYDFEKFSNNFGMAMMLSAIAISKNPEKKKYIYLGSATRPEDKYKLQFKGLEWFDGQNWQQDQVKLNELLSA